MTVILVVLLLLLGFSLGMVTGLTIEIRDLRKIQDKLDRGELR